MCFDRDPRSTSAVRLPRLGLLTMLGYGQRMNRNAVELHSLITYWNDRIHHLLAACTRDRDILPAQRSIDIMFHEFMADDIKVVTDIYDLAGIEMNNSAAAQLQHYIDTHPRGKHGKMTYNLQADFGVSAEEIRKPFKFYFDRFPVKAEAK